jgi:hypothetical protein
LKIGKAVRHQTKCGKIITAIKMLIALEEMQVGMNKKCVDKIKSIERGILKVIENLVKEIKNDTYYKRMSKVDKIIDRLKKLKEKCEGKAEEIDELIKNAQRLY